MWGRARAVFGSGRPSGHLQGELGRRKDAKFDGPKPPVSRLWAQINALYANIAMTMRVLTEDQILESYMQIAAGPGRLHDKIHRFRVPALPR